jgi:hypothetical protein
MRNILADHFVSSSQEVHLPGRNEPTSSAGRSRSKTLEHNLYYNANPFERVYNNVNFEKVLKLQSQLKNNKILMNMAIHDMRNPANAITFGVNETIQMLLNQKKKVASIKKMR